MGARPVLPGNSAPHDMALRAAILWIHVLCGVIWVGASASFVLALSALSAQRNEWREFAVNVTPRINRICLATAALIPLTGIGNLIYAGIARDYVFPPEFMGILGAKIALYLTMAAALALAWHNEPVLREDGNCAGTTAAIRRLVWLYGLSVALGVAALALGLWLSGVK